MASSKPGTRVAADFLQRWPEADALATECALNLGHLYHQIEGLVTEWVRSAGLPSVSAFNVLTVLAAADEPLAPSVIAERMMVTRATISGVLDTLENRGLVRRETRSEDRRMVRTVITDQGRQLARHLMRELHGIEKEFMSVLSENEQEMLLGFVARLQRNLPTQPPPIS